MKIGDCMARIVGLVRGDEDLRLKKGGSNDDGDDGSLVLNCGRRDLPRSLTARRFVVENLKMAVEGENGMISC